MISRPFSPPSHRRLGRHDSVRADPHRRAWIVVHSEQEAPARSCGKPVAVVRSDDQPIRHRVPNFRARGTLQAATAVLMDLGNLISFLVFRSAIERIAMSIEALLHRVVASILFDGRSEGAGRGYMNTLFTRSRHLAMSLYILPSLDRSARPGSCCLEASPRSACAWLCGKGRTDPPGLHRISKQKVPRLAVIRHRPAQVVKARCASLAFVDA